MKAQLDWTKVVLRGLPPAITLAALMEQIDVAFAGRYNWVSFRPRKTSQKHQSYSRAYIDFRRPEDVVEFAEFFNGHMFVNEKGTQFKTIVEYAPSQRVPNQCSKKDGREGTILKDPEYLEFLEVIAKPVENLPSAEIQLERREAEQAGVVKDNPIITPLMDFVRQKRAAKAGPRRLLSNVKLNRRLGGSTGGSPDLVLSKRSSDKKTTMYILRDSIKNTSGKDKSAYVLVPKRDDQQPVDKLVTSASFAGSEAPEESGEAGKKKILLLKGKEREMSNALKNQRHEGSGRIIRGILLKQQNNHSNIVKDKRPPRPPHMQLALKDTNGTADDKVGSRNEKQERRPRNKDRPDRGVWTRHRSEGSYASDESWLSTASQPSLSVVGFSEGSGGDAKVNLSSARSGNNKPGGGRCTDNGSHRLGGRRGSTHGVKDADGTSFTSEGKPLRRGGSSGYGSHEKQIWVQKSSSGS